MTPPDRSLIFIDVETTGVVPGFSSMISLAAVTSSDRFDDGETWFSGNLEELPGSPRSPSTMEWWAEYPDQWDEARDNPSPINEVIGDFDTWLGTLGQDPITFISWRPFDYAFISWYFARQGLDTYKTFKSWVDARSYFAGMFRRADEKFGWDDLPERWSPTAENKHEALSDAMRLRAMWLEHLKDTRRGP